MFERKYMDKEWRLSIYKTSVKNIMVVFLTVVSVLVISIAQAKSNDFNSDFVSPGGRYGFKIKYSFSAATMSPGFEQAVDDFARKNSNKGLWTLVLIPMNHIIDGVETAELPVGVDVFMRHYGKEKAVITIKWAKILYNVAEEFAQAKKVLQRDGIWIDGSEMIGTCFCPAYRQAGLPLRNPPEINL
jgi:hypothetical protein